jgi:BirA family transcriptional regulator, biotin operon repressor / biotin---[acetyl-CoA-carboxylase] ligase
VTSDLDRDRIELEIERSGATVGRPLSIVDVTGSTNDDAKVAAHQGIASGAAFVADAQTAGRGRLGRAWHSPRDENLYVSFVWRQDLPSGNVLCVTLAAGLAVAEAIAPLVAREVRLKWPNDVFVGDRKIAGVLCEAAVSAEGRTRFVVVGIGINVRTTVFPPGLSDLATSLASEGAADLDRSAILVSIATALSARMAMLARGETERIVRDFSARALALPNQLR